MITEKQREELSERRTKQNEEIDQLLKRKDYILTILQTGDVDMSSGDPNRQADTRRFWTACSLEEISEYIDKMKTSWWSHPDLKKGSKVKEKDIPFEEKKWGIYTYIKIEPLSEELEKSYVNASKEGFFETHRQHNNMLRQGLDK